MDEGGKRVLGIMAAILAVRNFIAFPQTCGTTIDPVRRPSANDFWGVLLLPSTKLGDMTVRIVTWKCGMALARKVPSLLALNPDIAVVQECSKKSLDVLQGDGLFGLWFGAQSEQGSGCLLQQRVHSSSGGRTLRQMGNFRLGSGISQFQLAGGLGLPGRD
jgi:hypothetical protein